MRELAINYGSTEQLINHLFNILNNLDIEKSNVKRALNELYDLENHYSNKGEIISELEYRERKIDKDIRDTEDLIKSLQSFSRSVQETDEILAQKFKQDVKSYSKKNNIELVSELDKFLNKAEMTLDALGLVPGIGEVADGINGILSLLRGNWGNALISFGSMIPIAGDSLKGVKYLDKASDLLKMGDKVVDLEKSGKKLSKVADKLDDLKIKDIDFNISTNKSKTISNLTDFTWKLRGENVTLKNVKTKEIVYKKRATEELNKLRKEFNTSIRKSFLEDISKDVEYLKKVGFSDKDILKIKNGRVPNGWQVHHKLPLDDSGTNTFENLVLIKNEPYHKVITNYQNSFSRNLKNGEVKNVDWPIPNGKIYPKNIKGGF